MELSKTDLLTAFYERVWLQGDLDAIDQFMGGGENIQGVMTNENVGTLDMKTLVEAFLGLVEEPQFEILQTIEQGDWLSALMKVHATAAMSGQPVSITGQVMFRLKDGIIAEAYNHFDYMGFFEQIGLMPADSLPQLLTGAMVA